MNKFLIISFFLIISGQSFCQDKDKEEREREGKDSSEVETEEVVITGTRTLKKIIDIPFSVFRVDRRELKYGRGVSPKDILADVPGLFLQSRYGSHDVRISIRGFGTRSNSGVRGIRILQDGIPESEPDGETVVDAIDFSSLGGVEVVKGNSSSLYTNAPGGVINFLSDVSFPVNFIKQSNEFGSFDLRQNGVKLGLRSKNMRYFMSYSYRNFKGFRVHSSEYTHLINSFYQGYLTSTSSFSILANFVKGTTKLPGALTKEEYDTNPDKAWEQALSFDFKRITGKGRLGVRYNNVFGKNNSNEIELTGYGSIKDLESTTNQLYILNSRYAIGSTIRYVNKSLIVKRDNEFSVGGDYYFVTGPVSAYNNVLGIKGDELQSQTRESINNYGFYFQNQFNLVKKRMDLLLTGRYDKIIFTVDNLIAGYQNSSRKFDKFTPKAALNFKILPQIAVYTSFGLGFDTPAASELLNYQLTSNNGLTTLNPDLNPQTSKNFELGIKGNVLNKKSELEKLFFDITFFNTQIDDEIVPFIINNTAYFRNAAKTNRTGVEVGIKLEAFEGLELSTNYTFAHFKYKDYRIVNYDSAGTPHNEDFTNNIVPSGPEHIVNLILNYQYHISKKVTALIQLDGDYIGKMFVDDKNSASTEPYFYGNTLAGAEISLKKFNILLTAGFNNVFNKKYVGFININDVYGRFYERGEPRSFYSGINLTYTFGKK